MSEAELFTTRYRIRWSFHICEQTWRQLASESAWRLSPLSCKPVSPATGPWTAVLKWPDGAVALSLRFRIQEMRLQLWGRSAGVNFEDDQHNGQDGDQKDKQLSPGSGILEILPMRELVMDVLGRILEVLDRHMEIKRKYNTLRAEPFENPPSPTPSSAMHIRGALQQKVKEVSRKTSLTGKIRWGLKDKGSLDVLLEELTALNDGLENLLIRRDVSLLSQCLMGEIVDESRPLALGQADPQALVLLVRRPPRLFLCANKGIPMCLIALARSRTSHVQEKIFLQIR